MKKLSFLFGVVVLFGWVSLVNADDYAPGRVIVDIKHEYLPINIACAPAGATVDWIE